ncbi:MAG: response regulator [Betaproteobacteria bacterium RIFCSPLOWO2_12_FULL_64_23]|nr:MAG: response regulator [Betaproteobacteria bacterium RIFCSPLOWO2_12_FULL_64_23]
MNHPASGDPAARTCRLCGCVISGLQFSGAPDGYCCEGCFLAERKQRSLAAALDEAQFALAEALAEALDAREGETGLHSKRVACHTLVLAKHFTDDPQRLHQVYWGALLHDIGKIGIPDSVLLKHGSLNDAEWTIMRGHPQIGHHILANAPFLAEAAEIVLSHEERFDGTGYPRGLAGSAIPLWARLFAVIDTLDAITSDRPYRRGASFKVARTELLRVSGTQLDPIAIEVFVAEEATLREMVETKCNAAAVESTPAAAWRTSPPATGQ